MMIVTAVAILTKFCTLFVPFIFFQLKVCESKVILYFKSKQAGAMPGVFRGSKGLTFSFALPVVYCILKSLL